MATGDSEGAKEHFLKCLEFYKLQEVPEDEELRKED